MARLLTFKWPYFLLTVMLFCVEVLIALFIDDRFIRPYFGDFLVVILVYCFLRSFITLLVFTLAMTALLFAYFVETLQYFDVVRKLGLEKSTLAKTVMGSSFEWSDMLAYTLGICLVLYVEHLIATKFYTSHTKS